MLRKSVVYQFGDYDVTYVTDRQKCFKEISTGNFCLDVYKHFYIESQFYLGCGGLVFKVSAPGVKCPRFNSQWRQKPTPTPTPTFKFVDVLPSVAGRYHGCKGKIHHPSRFVPKWRREWWIAASFGGALSPGAAIYCLMSASMVGTFADFFILGMRCYHQLAGGDSISYPYIRYTIVY